ncbi:MAG: hypothetical protein HXS48_07390 [Theionarchaea archaeon]|nr:hypothetical protein [Theionarchaea archaeon]
MFVAGDFDYFVTTRQKTINFGHLDLEIVDKSLLYTPLFTIPKGWNKPVNECLDSILNFDFSEKKKIKREVNAYLNWREDHWNIYRSMRGNIRKPFAKVGKETNLDHKTVKKYFYETIFPCCAVNYYFFPHGFDTYRQTLLQIITDYETELVKAFEHLSCTTYIYPFEKEIWVDVFHRDCNRLMTVVQKLEEIGVVEKYKGHTPISCEEI